MNLPKHFDANEIFVLAVGLGLIVLFLIAPKRFTNTEIVLILLLNVWLAATADHILAGPPFNKYDILDSPKFEVMDLFIYLFVYPPSGYFLVYVYDLIIRSLRAALIYIPAAAAITILLEWTASKFGVFTYFEWNFLYSFLSYLILSLTKILFYLLVKKLVRKKKAEILNK